MYENFYNELFIIWKEVQKEWNKVQRLPQGRYIKAKDDVKKLATLFKSFNSKIEKSISELQLEREHLDSQIQEWIKKSSKMEKKGHKKNATKKSKK